MKKLVIILLILLLASPAWARTEHFVCPAAAGTEDGSSIANCWDIDDANTEGNWTADKGANPNKIGAGDTIYLQGGTYTASRSSYLNFYESGTSGSRIYLKHATVSSDPNKNSNVAVFDAGSSADPTAGYGSVLDISSQSYITIDGNDGAGNRMIKIQYTKRNNGASKGLAGVYCGGGDNGNILIQYLELYRCGSGISCAVGGKGLEVAYNKVSETQSGIGIEVSGSLATTQDDIKVHHNEVSVMFDPTKDADKRATDNFSIGCPSKFYNNYSYLVSGTNYYDDHGDHVHYVACAGKVDIYNNRMQHTHNSFIIFESSGNASVSDIRVWNNIFEGGSIGAKMDVGFGMRSPTTSVDGFYYYNNTHIDQTGSNGLNFDMTEGEGTISNFFIKNNIFYNTGTSGGTAAIYIHNLAAAWTFTGGTSGIIDYNAINGGAHGGTTINVQGAGYTQDHPQTNAPSFSSYTEYSDSNVLTLSASDTVAKDNGVALASDYNTDKNGVSRPQGSTWDIGAYEFIQSSTGFTATGVTLR